MCTRALRSDISKAGEFAPAHGEVFAGIDPVTSGVEVGLITPGMMVEIEVDALVHAESGIHWWTVRWIDALAVQGSVGLAVRVGFSADRGR